MLFMDFYELAVYANENWKGGFTKQEINKNANIYYDDFLWSIRNNEVSYSIKTLCDNLEEDIICGTDDERVKIWLHKIKSYLGMF